MAYLIYLLSARLFFVAAWDWHAIMKFIFPLEREDNQPLGIIFAGKALDT